MKTKKTLLKRIKITKSGKVLKKQNNMGHLNSKYKASKKHRKDRLEHIPNKGYLKKVKIMLAKHGSKIDMETNTKLEE